ncbi:MAG: LPS-assembly protein LptD [Terriglobia bacterium]
MYNRSSAPSRRLARSRQRLVALVSLAVFAIALPLIAQQSCSDPPAFQSPETLTLNTSAASQQWVKGRFTAQGHVVITYRDMRIAADTVTYDDATHELDARGHVVLDDPSAHFEADSAHYNIVTDSGWLAKVHGYLRYAANPKAAAAAHNQPKASLYLSAEKITRLGEDTFTISGLEISSCRKPDHGLAFGMQTAKIEVGHSVSGRGAVFRFLGIPVLYLPYAGISAARQARQTGFLIPQISDSTQKGFVIGDGIFWAINPSADLLAGVENFSRRGVGLTGRFRARPSETSEISANVFGIHDRGSGPLRAIRAPGASFSVIGDSDDLGDGFRGVVNVDYVNSLAFRTAWSSNFNTAVFSEAEQTGFATKNFDGYSLNFFASRYQDFLSAAPVNEQSIIIRHLPSVSFDGVDHELGRTPLYFSLETAAEGVGRSDPSFSTPILTGRLDLFPRLTLRTKPFAGFHLTPIFGVRETYYTTSLAPGHGPVNRFVGDVSVDLRPPPLEKVFARPLWGHRLKHVIEPDVQYRLVKPTDPQNIFDVVRFDTTDLITDDNELQFSLANTLLERKVNTSGQTQSGQAREFLSWTLTQKYFFDPTFGGTVAPGSEVAITPALSLTGFAFPEGRRWSPLDSVLRFSPASGFDTELRTDIDPEGGGVLNAGITSRIHSRAVDLAFTDFFVSRTIVLPAPIAPNIPLSSLPSFDLLDLMASHGDSTRKGLTEAFRVDYNLSQGIVEDFIGQASYNFGCFTVNAQYQRFNLGSIRNENLFRVSLTLGNIGTFGSLRPGQFIERQLQQIP